MLNRSKALLEKTINDYIYEKKNRWIAKYVKEVREREIKTLLEKIISPATNIRDLLDGIVVYIPTMYKHTKYEDNTSLPTKLRAAIHQIITSIGDTHQDIQHQTQLKLDSTLIHQDSKDSIKELKTNGALEQWYKEFHPTLLSAITKSVNDSNQLGLINALLGPANYAFNNIESYQAGLDARMKRLEIQIEMMVWKRAYLVFKPYEERIYRTYVFEKNYEAIENQYYKDTERLTKDTKTTIQNLTRDDVISELSKALSIATSETVTKLLVEPRKKRDEAISKCKKIQEAYEKDFIEYKIDTDSLIITSSTGLSDSDVKAYKEYEKKANIHRNSILSSPAIYESIATELSKKAETVYSEIIDSINIEYKDLSISHKFKHSMHDYIIKRTIQYTNALIRENVMPLKWSNRKFGIEVENILKRYKVLSESYATEWINHVKNNPYTPGLKKVEDDYKKQTKKWLDKFPTKAPEFKNLLDKIIAATIDNTPPSSITGPKPSSNLMMLAMNNYILTAQNRLSDSHKTRAYNLVLEFIRRGAIIDRSPTCLLVNQNDNKDFHTLQRTWILLERSLKNIRTISGTAALLKKHLLNYFNHCADVISSYSGFFYNGHISFSEEIKRLDKAFTLLQKLNQAFKNEDDSKLMLFLTELSCDKRMETGLCSRISFASMAKQLTHLIDSKRDTLFYMDENQDKLARGLSISPSSIFLLASELRLRGDSNSEKTLLSKEKENEKTSSSQPSNLTLFSPKNSVNDIEMIKPEPKGALLSLPPLSPPQKPDNSKLTVSTTTLPATGAKH